MDRKIIYLFMAIGGAIGGLIPELWGAGLFSLSSVLFTALGGIAGIYVGYRISQ